MKEFILRLVNAVKAAEENPIAFRDRWITDDSRSEFLETMADKGFDEGRLREVQKMLNQQ